MSHYFFTEEHEMFRKSLRTFMEREVLPHIDQWETDGRVPKELFVKMGKENFFGVTCPEKYGGMGGDFFYDVILLEEIARAKSGGLSAAISGQEFLALSHLVHEASDELKDKYLPASIRGELVGCLAITEPGAGSDVANIKTTAVRDGDHYIINGAKMFITNGVYSDYLIVAAKTTKDVGAAGISLIIVDRDSQGLSARKLKKLGWHASDTGDISFEDVRVPVSNLLGEENKGFYYIMQRFELERLIMAIGAVASAEDALHYTLEYMAQREAFGRPINKFQALRHRIATLATELEIAKIFNYQLARNFTDGNYAVKECAMAKLHATELSDKVMHECLQFFGGYGFMEEYKIARLYRDSRLGPIGGGTSEIMREIIAKMVIDGRHYSAS